MVRIATDTFLFLPEDNMLRTQALSLATLTALLFAGLSSALAQAPPTYPPYGEPISLEMARKAIAAAEVEAKKNSWPVAIAVTDGAGHLVAFARLENAQIGSIEVAIQKAKTSAQFRRPSKAFQDIVAMGGDGLRILTLPGAVALEGGIPILHDGKVIGAIGVSGVKSSEDAQIAAAGVEALKSSK